MKFSNSFSALAQKSLKLVEIEGGSFMMGNNTSQWSREIPEHKIKVSGFYLASQQVNQMLWKEIMKENPSHFEADRLPVEQISWKDCQLFLKKLNQQLCIEDPNPYRLPTEAEWEYAARGGKFSRNTIYSGSVSLQEVGWFGSGKNWNSHNHTQTSGLRISNELGLYDLSGNVREWCWDKYGNYSDDFLKDPQGPEYGEYRVLRGGSRKRGADYCRVSYRYINQPDSNNDGYGFRLARSLKN